MAAPHKRARKEKARKARNQNDPNLNIKRIVSIPSRFETVMKRSADELQGFGSTSHRFHGEEASAKLDPGQYFKMNSAESKSPSYSAKGFGSGFISRTHRFKSFEYSSEHLCTKCEEGLHPIHGSTFNNKHSRSTSFSKSRHASHSAYFSQQMKRKAQTPGPGSYSHRVPRLSGTREKATASFSSNSKRYFDGLLAKIESQNKARSTPDGNTYTWMNFRANNKENHHKVRKAAFNTSETRFVPRHGHNDAAIQAILFEQSQHQNSRRINRRQSKQAIISTIMQDKAALVDQPGPGQYFDPRTIYGSSKHAPPSALRSSSLRSPMKQHSRQSGRSLRNMRVNSNSRRSILHLDLNQL